jgi:hypothetical protein
MEQEGGGSHASISDSDDDGMNGQVCSFLSPSYCKSF